MPAQSGSTPVLQDTALYVALIMAAFAILFGTRHIDASEHHEGMVAAIAFESVVKLLAFLAVGVFVTYGVYEGFGDLFSRGASSGDLAKLFTIDGTSGYTSWISLTVLAMLAIFVLPRQFQVLVVENVDERHVKKAVWLFPLYLLLINIFVLPIAFGGLLHFSPGSVDADTFVLALPMAERQQTIVLLAFRRGAIVVIVLLGYAYVRLIGETYALVTIGLVSFVAAAQFAPAIVGGILWTGATKAGALAGLTGGFLVWIYTLLLPSFARSGWIGESFVNDGPFGFALLRPYELFGLSGLDSIAHALFWTMVANVGFYVAVSLVT